MPQQHRGMSLFFDRETGKALPRIVALILRAAILRQPQFHHLPSQPEYLRCI